MIGCSTFAEIGQDEPMDGSVTVMGVCFEGIPWSVHRLDTVGESSRDAGRRLAEEMKASDPHLVVLLPDGVAANTMKLVHGMQDVLGKGTPIVGGMASEHFTFERTHQLFDGDVLDGGVVALAIGPGITVSTAVGSGFQPVGKARVATKVLNDKDIVELDGQPAADIYRDFLGEDVYQRPNIGLSFPLAVVSGQGDYMESDERSLVIRAVRQLDEDNHAICSAGDVYEGASVRLTRANKDDLIAAAKASVDRARDAAQAPELALVFNCAGRHVVLGARREDEVAAALDALGDIPRAGFYSYGEISPVDGENMYHDETFTVVLVGAATA